MSSRTRIPSLNDHYCQICSSSSLNNNDRRLSCFSCDHCNLSMCYACFDKHTYKLIDEYNRIQKRFSHLTNLFDDKRHLLGQFQENCIRSINSAFDETFKDLENLRRESINYVRNQFNDVEVSFMKIRE